MTFTVWEMIGLLFTGIVGGCGLVLTLLNIADKSKTLKKDAQEPERIQNERIDGLERKFAAMREEFEHYKSQNTEKVQVLEEGNRVTQQAILALLSHAIDGNNIDQMEKARNDLNSFLINK